MAVVLRTTVQRKRFVVYDFGVDKNRNKTRETTRTRRFQSEGVFFFYQSFLQYTTKTTRFRRLPRHRPRWPINRPSPTPSSVVPCRRTTDERLGRGQVRRAIYIRLSLLKNNALEPLALSTPPRSFSTFKWPNVLFNGVVYLFFFFFFQRWQSASKIKKNSSVFYVTLNGKSYIFLHTTVFESSLLVKRGELIHARRENELYSVSINFLTSLF